MVVPFKNLVNDAYCRDISIKIRSSLETKRKRGEHTGAFAVYGYVKDEKNKNQLVADAYAADVVRDIFSMKLCGMGQQAIADKLNKEGILSPMEYKRSIGIHFETSFKKKAQAGWSYNAVLRILQNEIYTGVLVQGKQTTPNYKVKTRIKKAEEEWTRVENTHEAVISRTDFMLVQELLKQDTRTAPEKEVLYPLAGLLYCGDCMEPMVRKTVPAGGRKYVYYVCSGNKKDKTVCSPHRIAEKGLEDTVLAMLQVHIGNVLGLEKALQALDNLPKVKAGQMKFDARIQKKQEELDRTEKRKMNLYEDFKDGILSKKEYMQLKMEYDRRAEEAETAICSYKKELQMLMDNKGNLQKWMEEFKKYQNIQSLDRNAAAVLVKRILVYSADRIEISYNFEDELERCRTYAAVYGKSTGKEAV